MAPIGEAYFPPLDRCFSGQLQLLSWKATYVALSGLNHGSNKVSLENYFADPQTVQILAHAFSPFQAPNQQTKSSFETKTSAINAAPSPYARYDIKQVQEDTLWLSKQTKIDEVSALRITIIELQTRPSSQLLLGRTEQQSNHRSYGGGSGGFGASKVDLASTLLAKSTSQGKESPKPSEEVDARRRRLLEIYLSERRCILKCCEYLIFVALSNRDGTKVSQEHHISNESNWLIEVGNNVLSSWMIDDATRGGRKHPIIAAVDALRVRLEGMSKGSGWLQDEGVQEDVELAWARSQVLEMIHIMQISLDLLQSSANLVKSSAILSWFRLMRDCEFFDNVQLPPDIQTAFGIPLASLPALVSLAALNLPSALDLLGQSASTAVPTTSSAEQTPYVLHTGTVNEINDILIAVAPLRPASLAVMAWAIMMNNLRDTALGTRESRETRQSLRAADKYGAADSSDTDTAERPSPIRTNSSLHRRSSTGSDTSQQSTLLEDIYDTVAYAIVDGGDPIAYLANNAAGNGVVFEVMTVIAVEYCTRFGFEHNGKPGQIMRGMLLDLVRASVDFVDYSPLLLTATLAALTGSERYWEALDRPADVDMSEPAAVFLQDKVLTHKLYFVSMLHFPHESLPFLELCRALAFANNGSNQGAPAMWTILEEADNFTCSLPGADYQAYVSTHMQEEANFIELTEDLNVSIVPERGGGVSSRFNSAQRALTKYEEFSSFHNIPSRTSGKLMNESKPFIVAWHQSYSPLAYMGKVLRCASTAHNIDTYPSSFLSTEIVGEIIGLIANMLSAATKRNTDSLVSTDTLESAQLILGLASENMGRNQDIISVIFDIFEKELYKTRKSSEDIDSMETIVQCTHFAFALLQVMPDRVWPFLGRSGLLGIGQDDSQLRSVVATQEMIVGRYDFLLGCIRLFDSLVTDAIAHAVSRKVPTKALARFGSGTSGGAGVSYTTMESVLLNLTRTMIEVLESTKKWRFREQEDRMEINYRLCSTLQRILCYYYGVGEGLNTSQKLASPLAPSAHYIVDVFLSISITDVTIKPLLYIFEEGTATSITTLPIRGLQYWTAQVKAALELSNTLIRVNELLQHSPSHLEEEMFTAAATIAKVYAAHEDYKLPVVKLFDSLIRSAAKTSQQPPSLLGHLGHEDSSHFLDALSTFDQPIENDELSSAIWTLLSAVVSKRQQWFAIFVLTGATPRDSFKDKTTPVVSSHRQSEPILNTALDTLSNIDKLKPRKALSILKFVALAADFWPWVLSIMEKHSHFLKGISEYAAHIGSMAATSGERSYKTFADYNSLEVASLVADILSMYIHHTQQIGNQKFAKMLVPHLTYLIKNAISIPSYNASLHGNLRRNFESKFPGCDLNQFKHTKLTDMSLGESFYYDLGLATETLSYDPAWIGRKGDDGFSGEFRRANFNLSVVESQINLFHSWKSLLIELSGPLTIEPKFQKIMAVAVIDCLKANSENILPEVIFERLALSRATLAFTLLQRLLEAKSTQAEVMRVLPVAWDTIRTYNANVRDALDGKGADYYRILLKVLFLSLQAHTIPISSSDLNASQKNESRTSNTGKPNTYTALEIISTIAAQGFRSLTTVLHENSTIINPSDFALLTAILRSALQVPDVSENTTQLLNAFSDSQTARCASTLLSWSDQLATSGDPVYGELSVLFLLEMSSVPALAESLAVEGALSQMLSTNLVRLLQSRSFGPFNQPVRMYSIWARGILPFLLNLLYVVGAPLAAEVAAALNTFPHQLDQAGIAFTFTSNASSDDPNRDRITLSKASEAVTLSLITTVLQSFREAGASVGIVSSAVEEVKWDRTQVREEIEACLQRRAALRERIVATNEREEVWSRTKPTKDDSDVESQLEEKIVEEMRTVLGILDGNSE